MACIAVINLHNISHIKIRNRIDSATPMAVMHNIKCKIKTNHTNIIKHHWLMGQSHTRTHKSKVKRNRRPRRGVCVCMCKLKHTHRYTELLSEENMIRFTINRDDLDNIHARTHTHIHAVCGVHSAHSHLPNTNITVCRFLPHFYDDDDCRLYAVSGALTMK